MKTLAIETSCDDTSLAIVREENGTFFVDKMLAYSQIQDHQKYGGVVPEIAFRLHSEQIVQLLAHFIDDIPTLDRISVTTAPGLA
jgi:N6-L-threonylcarbamoyladenine synthase